MVRKQRSYPLTPLTMGCLASGTQRQRSLQAISSGLSAAMVVVRDVVRDVVREVGCNKVS